MVPSAQQTLVLKHRHIKEFYVKHPSLGSGLPKCNIRPCHIPSPILQIRKLGLKRSGEIGAGPGSG